MTTDQQKFKGGFRRDCGGANARTYLDGNSWWETADKAQLDITSDIDIRAAIAVPVVPTTAQRVILAKWGTNQQSYGFQSLAANIMNIFWDDNGVGPSISDSSGAYALTADVILGIRAAIDMNTGGGTRLTTFYMKPTSVENAAADMASDTSWNNVATVAGLAASSIFAGTANLIIGALNNTPVFPFIGNIYSVVIKNGIAGTTVANPDFVRNTSPFTDGAGNLWTKMSV